MSKKIQGTIQKQFGDKGELFIKQYCEDNNIKFIKGRKSEDLRLGVDCFFNDIPTDIKNTQDIYICQIMLDTGLINTRHPFKDTTHATHYCFVSVNDDKQEFIEHISIEECLLRDFIKDKDSLIIFRDLLKEFQGKSYKDFGISLEQTCMRLKLRLIECCKEGVNIRYPEPKDSEGEISFRIIKQSRIKPATKIKSSDMNSILKNIKTRKETPIKGFIEEEIITIKV